MLLCIILLHCIITIMKTQQFTLFFVLLILFSSPDRSEPSRLLEICLVSNRLHDSYTYKEMDRQINRTIDKQMDRQLNRQIGSQIEDRYMQIDRQLEDFFYLISFSFGRQTDRYINRCMNRHLCKLNIVTQVLDSFPSQSFPPTSSASRLNIFSCYLQLVVSKKKCLISIIA